MTYKPDVIEVTTQAQADELGLDPNGSPIGWYVVEGWEADGTAQIWYGPFTTRDEADAIIELGEIEVEFEDSGNEGDD